MTDGVRRSVAAAGLPAGTFTVEGPVLAEILVLTLDDKGAIQLTGPCGPAPWFIEVAGDPMADVVALTRRNLGEPLVAHSTSWRRDRDAVVLTFVAVMAADAVADLESIPVARSELARGAASAAPTAIGAAQVIEHALRHLAWLIRDDEVVAERLGTPWRAALEGYAPEPFRALPE